jgi:hypothetical protein
VVLMIHTAQQLKKKLPAFREFLVSRGAEVLQPTNEWEIVRFRAGGGTAIVYTNARGHITAIGAAKDALDAFGSGGNWRADFATKRDPKKRSVDVRSLLARDGDRCFLCRQPLGDDITVEHLVPIAARGPDTLANKALAHQACNLRMGHLSVMEKIALREQVGSSSQP